MSHEIERVSICHGSYSVIVELDGIIDIRESPVLLSPTDCVE